MKAFNAVRCARRVGAEHFLADRKHDRLTTKCDRRNAHLAKEEQNESADVLRKGKSGGCA